jgi:hypothetical protein
MVGGDAVRHYLLEVSEQQLYLAVQGAVTLFDDLLGSVFADSLAARVPTRVLPVSTEPPKDLTLLIDDEVSFIRELVVPGARRLGEAKARLLVLLGVQAARNPVRTIRCQAAGRYGPPRLA